MQTSFGLSGTVLQWISSYLSNRSQYVQLGQSKSPISPCTCGVLQGSVLGPILITLFISPVSLIASSHSVFQQQYADDNQLYIAISHSDSNSSITSLQSALLSFYSWFSHNGLALNHDKSDAILLDTSQCNSSLNDITCVDVAGTLVTLANIVKLLDVILDSNLTFSKHVSSVWQASYYHIRALRHSVM